MRKIESGDNAKVAAQKGRAKEADNYVAKDHIEVCIQDRTIARMYVRPDGTAELQILHGMLRDLMVQKLVADWPDFCKQNGIDANTYPLLF